MARGVNKVILIGNLGKDPDLTYSQSGTAIAKFSLATTEGRKNQSGEWEDETEWHNIVLFGKTAETAGQYLSKGSQVYIEGKIQTRKYEQDGQTKYFTSILGRNMQLLGRRDDAQGGGGQSGGGGGYPPQQKPGPAAPADDIEDDLPF